MTMATASDLSPTSRAEEVDRNLALLAYGLLFVAIFAAGLPALVAVAIAYARRRSVGPGVASHHRFQIFIFWVGFGLTLLAAFSGLAALLSLLIGMFTTPTGGRWNGFVVFGVGALGLGLITGFWLMSSSVYGFIRLASQHAIRQTAR